ncbi:hypothetical protein BDV26DRAFT_289294 [Aspergillus bertholletiae]|uniref:Aminoglycoside phosphotransferase domain-containing protein n=1 Tax=Aspergillus bertholletiae TaxID=1226010 RepID=A0A5N7BIP6_9EURO|nr:hypothetical protein BDV26DRAFT_289294 [Aspergillus bertholletiae]
MQALDGHPIYSHFLFPNKVLQSLPHGPLASDNDLWAEMECGSEAAVPETARIRLRNRMPPAAPCTFTHNDLTNVNIMVGNRPVPGVTDWEMSGYFPVWWEYVCTSIPDSEEDREWKTLLRKHMPDHSAAREFWLDDYYLCNDLKHQRARKFIAEAEVECL